MVLPNAGEKGDKWIDPFFRVTGGWGGIKMSIIPAGKVCPHIKTMKMKMMMMMILFKTIKSHEWSSKQSKNYYK